MGYYLRVLSTSPECLTVGALQKTLQAEKWQAKLTTEEGESDDWTSLLLSHADGSAIASIERDVVEEDSLGAEELEEFAEEVADAEPIGGAKWLLEYFERVRTIYAFQVLDGSDRLAIRRQYLRGMLDGGAEKRRMAAICHGLGKQRPPGGVPPRGSPGWSEDDLRGAKLWRETGFISPQRLGGSLRGSQRKWD
jgi:hypothetical protein